MSLRFKLIGAMLLMSLVTLGIGAVAITRVSAIDREADALGQSLPLLTLLEDLKRSQQEQASALLAYLTAGRPSDLEQSQTAARDFDLQFADLQLAASDGDLGISVDSVTRLAEERATYVTVAEAMVESNAAVRQGLGATRAQAGEIERELASLRLRYVSDTSGATLDPAGLPESVRTQIDDLLLGSMGMLYVVGMQSALLTEYSVAPSASLQQQFEAAGQSFERWLDVANAAGGAEDRAILARVRNRYVNQFVPAGRSLMQSVDAATVSLDRYAGASAATESALDESIEQKRAEAIRADESTASNARRSRSVVIVATIASVALALVLGLVLSARIVGPIVRLRDSADRASRGDLTGVDVTVERHDEVGDLARAIHRLVVSVNLLIAAQQEPSEHDQSAVLEDRPR